MKQEIKDFSRRLACAAAVLLLSAAASAQKKVELSGGGVKLEWEKKNGGYRLKSAGVAGRQLPGVSGKYGFIYSAGEPDRGSLIGGMEQYIQDFPEKEFHLIYDRWREALSPVALNEAGEMVAFYPGAVSQSGGALVFRQETPQASVEAVWSVDPEFAGDIRMEMTVTAKLDGWFSIVSPTLAAFDESDLEWAAIPGQMQGRRLEPNLVWSYGHNQGIPDRPVVVRERTATTLCPVISSRRGVSLGVIPDPGQARHPWEKDDFTQNEWRLGLSLVNRGGQLTPSVYHPVLGEKDSYMEAGESRTLKLRYTISAEDWYAVYRHAIYDVYRFADFLALKDTERSLTERILAMGRYLRDDSLSMWHVFDMDGTPIGAQEYHSRVLGDDYDAAKNSDYGAMWMMAAISDTDGLLRETRLPYARNFKLKQQELSDGWLRGAAAGQYYLYKSGRFTEEWGNYVEPVALTYYVMLDIGNILLFDPGDSELRERLRLGADRLLEWQLEDGSWAVGYDKTTHQAVFTDQRDLRPTFYGLVVAYRILGDRKYLEAACRGADWFVRTAVDEGQFLGVCGDFRFIPDFATGQSVEALLDLYRLSGGEKYREAAYRTARIYCGNIFTHPIPTAEEKTVKGKKRFDWQISQAGLCFEHGGTLGSNAKVNGPITLSSHAGMFVRLYADTGDELFLDMARAAAWGRDAFVEPSSGVASYYWNRFDQGPGKYPHHAWWQIGWIADYLVSEAMMRSGGEIDFPSGFITPKVGPHKCYGFGQGKVFGRPASLYLPDGMVSTDNPRIDYLCALRSNNKDLYVVLLNNSVERQKTAVSIDISKALSGQVKSISSAELLDAGGNRTGVLDNSGHYIVEIEPAGMSVIKLNMFYTEIQAHRGGAGLWPENTIEAMIEAIDMGVDVLELDMVISKDRQVVVSHEDVMLSDYVIKPDGRKVTKEEEGSLVLFQMDYDEIRAYDTGSNGNPVRYPQQKKMKTYKPLLSDLLDAAEQHARRKGVQNLRYNMEIKSSAKKETVGACAPYREFTDLCMELILSKGLGDRVTIQSFDTRVLNYLNEKYPGTITSYLVYKPTEDFEGQMSKLDFVPSIYSPRFSLVDEELVKKAHAMGMEILPWTADDTEELRRLSNFPIDGIITNYPDRAIEVFRD